jgi:Spy/CpxP family protein refolding chaperone
MRLSIKLLAAFGLLGLMASPAAAQQPNIQQMFQQLGNSFGKAMLLSQESVQKELKLSEEQLGKVKGIGGKQGEAMREAFKELFQGGNFEDMRKKLEEFAAKVNKEAEGVLDKDQNKRLDQISLQVTEKQQGLYAALRYGKGVAEELKITDEQKGKIQDIQDELQKETAELFKSLFQGGNREEMRKKMQEATKNANDKMVKVLDDDQKKKLTELKGEEFKGEIRQQFGIRPKPQP